jgi:hypothetical protein
MAYFLSLVSFTRSSFASAFCISFYLLFHDDLLATEMRHGAISNKR